VALSEEQKQKAREEARQYLEYSIYVLALSLGINPEELDENFENPETPESDMARYKSFNNLIRQIESLSRLSE
jgi:hypothetical protein